MYTLTAMTGRESATGRSVVIGTVEMSWRVWMLLLWSSPVGLLLTAILWPFLSTIAIVSIPVTWGIAYYLVVRRTRDGLEQQTYKAFLDKRRANTNQFVLCGKPINVGFDDLRIVMPNTVPVDRPSLIDAQRIEDAPDPWASRAASREHDAPHLAPAVAVSTAITAPEDALAALATGAPEPEAVIRPLNEPSAPITPPVTPPVAPRPVRPTPDPEPPQEARGATISTPATQSIKSIQHLDPSQIGIESGDYQPDLAALFDAPTGRHRRGNH